MGHQRRCTRVERPSQELLQVETSEKVEARAGKDTEREGEIREANEEAIKGEIQGHQKLYGWWKAKF